MTGIIDIYDGKILSCWKDDEMIFLSFPFCTINIPIEDWDAVKKELKKIAKTK